MCNKLITQQQFHFTSVYTTDLYWKRLAKQCGLTINNSTKAKSLVSDVVKIMIISPLYRDNYIPWYDLFVINQLEIVVELIVLKPFNPGSPLPPLMKHAVFLENVILQYHGYPHTQIIRELYSGAGSGMKPRQGVFIQVLSLPSERDCHIHFSPARLYLTETRCGPILSVSRQMRCRVLGYTVVVFYSFISYTKGKHFFPNTFLLNF